MTDQKALIKRMLKARTKEEVEAAKRTADQWLEENPEDFKILIARESLEQKNMLLSKSERVLFRISSMVFFTTSVCTGLLVFYFTGNWQHAVLASFLIGVSIFELIWMIGILSVSPKED